MATAIDNLMVRHPVPELDAIFRAHNERVLKAAYRITGNMPDAEDVAQSVFLRLTRADFDRGQINDVGSYLHRAAVNGALDLIRARGEWRTASIEDASLLQSDHRLSPERQHSSAEIRRWLRQALAQLHPRAAEMFALRYLEDFANPEIARMMNTSQAVVAVTLHRARARLKKGLRVSARGVL